jgi:integrase
MIKSHVNVNVSGTWRRPAKYKNPSDIADCVRAASLAFAGIRENRAPHVPPEPMRKPLTDTMLRALKKPAKGRTELADAACRGLEFRITAAGNRSWSYRYRAAGSGKLSRATIGPYPGISLADARLKADALRAGVAGGENPSEAKRRAKREAPGRTFKALSDRYLTEYARRKKRSAGQDERNLNLHILPKWKDRDYTTLRRADVIELIEGIISDGKPVMANRVQSLVSGIFSFAVDSDLIDANPCTRLKRRGEETAGERVLTDPEIRLFWLRSTAPPILPLTGLALRLGLLTGVRPGEAAGMWRSELEALGDPAGAIWSIPGARTKNGKDHVVPLCPLALETILEALALFDRTEQNDFPIFPARRKADKAMTARALAKAMNRLAKELPKAEKSWRGDPPTPHDLRRTFRTRLPQLGVAADIRDRLMNHIPSDVGSKHYDRYQYLDEKRAALVAWGASVSAILSGGAP